MEVMRDGVLAFLAAVGLSTLVWMAAGILFRTGRPVIPGLRLVLPLRGEASSMELDVRELRRLQARLPGAEIVLADCGLTGDARQLAQYLAEREPRAVLLRGEDPLIT